MTLMVRKFLTKLPRLMAVQSLGIVTILCTMLDTSAYADSKFVPLPSEQSQIISQRPSITPINTPVPAIFETDFPQINQTNINFYPLLPENVSTPVAIERIEGNSDLALKPMPNADVYYTIPNKPDDLIPLSLPEPEPEFIAPIEVRNSVTAPRQSLALASPSIKTIKPKIPTLKPITSAKPTPTKNTPVPTQRIPKKTIAQPQPVVKPQKVVKEQPSKQPPVKPIKEKIVPMVKASTLKFANFPAKVYTGKRVTPKITTLKNLNGFYAEALRGVKGEKQFIDTLSNTKPNYAGHYVITSFTCGLNCNASVAYDVKTGEFMELGGGFADCPATDFNPRQKSSITHQASSRLLIVLGSSSSGSCVAGYFEEKNGNVNLISQKNLMNFVQPR